jgi:predicted SPOUT superfamily RNA methylase MTH1
MRSIIINMALNTVMFAVLRSPVRSLYDYGTWNRAASIFRITKIILVYCGALESNGGFVVPRAVEK